jgi:hypothetical protein
MHNHFSGCNIYAPAEISFQGMQINNRGCKIIAGVSNADYILRNYAVGMSE